MNWAGVKGVLTVVGNIAKKGLVVIGPIVGTALLNDRTVHTLIDEFRYSGNVGYDDAVSAVMHSGMYSSDKVRAVNLIKSGKDSSYYKAVIEVVRSSSYSGDKLVMLENLTQFSHD